MNFEEIWKAIAGAMQGVLVKAWPDARAYATSEARKLATTLVDIEAMASAGSITPDQAGILLDMQRHASRAVILAVVGIGILSAEQAINAGLAAVASVVNEAVGFVLI